MTDIVKRLRQGVNTNEPPDKTDAVMWDAADEIERLRARNAEHEARYEALDVLDSERKAEIERLRTENAKLLGNTWEDARREWNNRE